MEADKVLTLRAIVGSALGSFAFTGLLLFYRVFPVAVHDGFPLESKIQFLLHELANPRILLSCIAIYVFIFALLLVYAAYTEKTMNWIYTWRYALALAALAVSVTLNINGSSLGLWTHHIPGVSDPGLLLGVNRPIRTDEWALFTPMAISQFFTHTGTLPYFADAFRGTGTDMFIVYGQPVLDPAVIFRPFHWGYLLFGIERGLSFFWCARLIALFMVTFEFSMLLTRGARSLSLACAILVSLSPIVSWWFAINGLVEMLVFGQLAVLLIYHYMKSDDYKIRAGIMLLMALCAGGYVLTFYPAWQVPLFYVFTALALGVIIQNRKNFSFSPGKDIALFILFLVLFGLGMLYIYIKSSETISTVLNTAYPGKRINTGGGMIHLPFRYPVNIGLPFTDKGDIKNVCEMASLYDFFPLGLLMSLWVIIKDKKRDPLLIALLTAGSLLAIYCFVGLPLLLAQITLLCYTTKRAFLALGLVNIVLLVRSMSLLDMKVKVSTAMLISSGLSLCMSAVCIHFNRGYVVSWMLMPIVFIPFLGFFFALRNKRKSFAMLCAILAFFTGILVNPVRIGAKFLYENELCRTIQTIDRKEGGTWIVDAVPFPVTNLPAMVGARTINSTNTYPNLKLWHTLDPGKKYGNVYNRYAHIFIVVTGNKTRFDLFQGDAFHVQLHVNDVKKLGPRHALSTRDLSVFNNEQVRFTRIDTVGMYHIFSIAYH
jgi:hypothetical protein